MKDESDILLLEKISRGQTSALSSLYDRYSAEIYTLLVRLFGQTPSIDKLLEDTFFDIWRNPARILQQLERGTDMRTCLLQRTGRLARRAQLAPNRAPQPMR